MQKGSTNKFLIKMIQLKLIFDSTILESQGLW
jgi:hypothetical protein